MHYFAVEDRKAYNLMLTERWLDAHRADCCTSCGRYPRNMVLPPVDLVTLRFGGWMAAAGRQGFIVINRKLIELFDESSVDHDLILNVVTEQGVLREDWWVVRPRIITHHRGTWKTPTTRTCSECGWIFYSNGGTRNIVLSPPYPDILGSHGSGLYVSPPIAERLRAATKRFRMDRVEVFDEPADGLGFFDLPPSMRLAEEGPLVTQA